MQEEFDGKTKVLTIVVGDYTFKTFNSRRRKKQAGRLAPGGAWRWHARGRNNRLVATSGERFAKRGNAERAMRRFIEGVRK